MRQASQMLVNLTMDVQTIANYVGYADSLTFSKAFKRFFSVSRIGIGHRLNGYGCSAAEGKTSNHHFSRTHLFSLPKGLTSFGIPM